MAKSPKTDSSSTRLPPRPGNKATTANGPQSSPKAADPPLPGSPWGQFPLQDEYPKVPDPVDQKRMVSTKQANRPFLAYTEYRAKRDQEHKAWLQRKKEREEKVARGEEVGPEEPDPTAEREIGFLGLFKFLLYLSIAVVLAGKFFTGSFLWELELPDLHKYFPPTNQRLFSEQMLANYDGTVESRPIYLAIDGDVFDVTNGRLTYGPGGSYHFMAGKDAARAFATGCFKTHQTHDIRGLSEQELQGLEHWKKFYAESKKYRKVGRVVHPPIDPMSPIPVHCDAKKAQASIERERAGPMPTATTSRDEL